jgi:hypothetical protein
MIIYLISSIEQDFFLLWKMSPSLVIAYSIRVGCGTLVSILDYHREVHYPIGK